MEGLQINYLILKELNKETYLSFKKNKICDIPFNIK